MKKRKLVMRLVESLRPPKGAAVNDDTVEKLASSLEHEGLREPLVITDDGYIIHGVHRWAAATKAGILEIECVVEGKSKTPEEHEAKVIAENLVRNVPGPVEREKLYAQLVDLRSARIKIERKRASSRNLSARLPINSAPSTPSKRTSRGRPESTTRAAIRQVAAAEGVNESTVERAVRKHAPEKLAPRRASKKTQQPAPPAPSQGEATGASTAHLDERGRPLPPHLVERYTITRAGVAAADKHLRLAQAELSRLEKSVEGLPTEFQKIRLELHRLAHQLRAAEPHTTCPYCKGTGKAQGKKPCCYGFGLKSKRDIAHTPQELLA